MLISIEADIRDIVAEHGLDLPFDDDAQVERVEQKEYCYEENEVCA